MKKFLKNNLLKIIIILSVIAIDLITKEIFDLKTIDFINGIISFKWAHNTGAGFSLLAGKTTALIIITSIFILGIIIYDSFGKNRSKFYMVSISFIIGGALGNLIDRIFLTYVRDFIKLEFINFPTFNIADSFLCVGEIMLILFVIFHKDKKIKRENNEIVNQDTITVKNDDSNSNPTTSNNGGKSIERKKFNNDLMKKYIKIHLKYNKTVEDDNEINKY